MQNNKKVRGYKELQKSWIKNCNQINEKLQEENYRIKNKCDSLIYLLKNEQNENRALKEKLRRFNERFVIFKELSINKIKKLDEELNIAKEKERNLNIRIIGDQDKEKIENHNKTEEYNNMKNKIMQNEIDLKKNGEIIRKYKNENLSIREENKKLKKEKVVLEINNNRLIKENEEMKNKIREMNKKMKDLEDKLKKGEKIFFTDLNKENNKQNKNKNKNKEENEFNDDYEE